MAPSESNPSQIIAMNSEQNIFFKKPQIPENNGEPPKTGKVGRIHMLRKRKILNVFQTAPGTVVKTQLEFHSSSHLSFSKQS